MIKIRRFYDKYFKDYIIISLKWDTKADHSDHNPTSITIIKRTNKIKISLILNKTNL